MEEKSVKNGNWSESSSKADKADSKKSELALEEISEFDEVDAENFSERPSHIIVGKNEPPSRRGSNSYAAKIGLAVLILAVVGVVAIVGVSIKAIKNSGSNSSFRAKIESFLYPVMIYAPESFENPSGEQQDSLLLSAAWLLIDEENARQQEQKTTKSIYTTDDLGRLVIPVKDVEKAYKKLFGDEAAIYHHSIGEENSPFSFTYDKVSGFYYIPALPVQNEYTPVVGSIKQEKEKIMVEIAFVLSSKIGVDLDGNPVAASADKADFKQVYTLQRRGKKAADGWKLVSVKDKEGKRTTATVITTTTEASETTNSSETKGTTTKATTAATTTKK